ncbi:hypothetical protein OK016_00165 [Vibrio chagasii]|nr:hypothetical protein [Vibrio chagasii]
MARRTGDAKQWCKRSLSLMARLQEPRRFQQDDVYVGGDTRFPRLSPGCNGRQLRELGERPNSSNAMTINDEFRRDHSEFASGCVSHRRREHHLHGDTDEILRMAQDG